MHESEVLALLHAAADTGVDFFDTADVYGNGRSESLVGRFLKERKDDPDFTGNRSRLVDPTQVKSEILS